MGVSFFWTLRGSGNCFCVGFIRREFMPVRTGDKCFWSVSVLGVLTESDRAARAFLNFPQKAQVLGSRDLRRTASASVALPQLAVQHLRQRIYLRIDLFHCLEQQRIRLIVRAKWSPHSTAKYKQA